MTKTLPISEVRQNLASLVDRAQKRFDEYVITVNGKPAAVLMSAAEYESWKETNEILADPVAMREISEAEKDVEAGRYITFAQLKKELRFD